MTEPRRIKRPDDAPDQSERDSDLFTQLVLESKIPADALSVTIEGATVLGYETPE